MSKNQLTCTNFVEFTIEEDYRKYEQTLRSFDLETLELEKKSIIWNPYLKELEIKTKIRLIKNIQRDKIFEIMYKKL